ncbi:type II secretion system protein [Aliarcobacter butzleri]|uniref:type II secretion system protein n=1 Tax=Aliarcobacter butzleri TaxID=28197 RepID=UPI0021B2B29D|nr:type II secretion system protein [Aliarcobacter butzleri]MCT7632109.1 type II secretion system GspH family protein [Aliarcobacter butzleri]
MNKKAFSMIETLFALIILVALSTFLFKTFYKTPDKNVSKLEVEADFRALKNVAEAAKINGGIQQ